MISLMRFKNSELRLLFTHRLPRVPQLMQGEPCKPSANGIFQDMLYHWGTLVKIVSDQIPSICNSFIKTIGIVAPSLAVVMKAFKAH